MGPSYIANDPIVVVFMIAGFLTFGTLMGVAVWFVAAMMGRSVAPTSPSPNDRFVRSGEVQFKLSAHFRGGSFVVSGSQGFRAACLNLRLRAE